MALSSPIFIKSSIIVRMDCWQFDLDRVLRTEAVRKAYKTAKVS